MGENWGHCTEFMKAMLVSVICFPFIPIVLLYWYFRTEEVHQAWLAIQNEENEAVDLNAQEVQRERQQLRDHVEETDQFWDHLRVRFLRQYGLDSDSIN